MRDKPLPEFVYTALAIVVAAGFLLVGYALPTGSASD
jgi:hypothetical protein